MFDARDGEFNLENVKGQLCIPVNLFTILFFVWETFLPLYFAWKMKNLYLFVVSSIDLTEDNLLSDDYINLSHITIESPI